MQYRPSRASFLCSRWIVGGAIVALVTLTAGVALQGCRTKTASAPDPAKEKPRIIPRLRTVSFDELGNFVGSKKCVSCHKDYAHQLQTNHAKTVRSASSPDQLPLFKNAPKIEDENLGCTYKPHVKNGRSTVSVEFGENKEDVDAGWVFGAGHRGFSYVPTLRGVPSELHVSYYVREKKWGITAGQENRAQKLTPIGHPLEPEEHQRCFLCHSTALVSEGTQLYLDKSILGVGCESCHGPGKEHTLAAERKDPDLRIRDLSQEKGQVNLELCGQCHRAFRNEDEIAKNVNLPRLQGTAMVMSACYKKSSGRFTCTTCHDPHRNAADTSRLQYNGICQSCHTPAKDPQQVACSFRKAGDCVACHMPEQKVPFPFNPTFRTHFIKPWLRDEPKPQHEAANLTTRHADEKP